MPELTLGLSQAIFWMNVYVALIAQNTSALARMRILSQASPGDPQQYRPDTSLLVREIARENRRLGYWEARVDTLRAAGGRLLIPPAVV